MLGEILTRLSEISYWFYVGKAKHKKSVTFFLMRYLSGDTANHDHEVDEARWFEVRAARKALKYVNEKRLVDMALEYVAANPAIFPETAPKRPSPWPNRRALERHRRPSRSARRFRRAARLALKPDQRAALDIATVPLASVAEQYLAYVRVMEDLDMEVAAEYLVIAATLVFLKSKALLPPIPQEFIDESEESAEQVEERLRRRLIAYSRYRELGVQLRARQDEASGFYFRDSGDPTSELVQHYRIDPEKLKRAFIIMLQQARPEKREVVRERVSLLAQMDYISRKVRTKERCHSSRFAASSA